MGVSRVAPMAPGTLIREYRIEKVIGQGGFGTTYLVSDLSLEKQFALKEYTPHHFVLRKKGNKIEVREKRFSEYFSRGLRDFLQEARRLARFSHPNIVRVSRFFEANGTAYVLTDLETGGSLRDVLNSRRTSFVEMEIRALLIPICSGVSQMHDEGLIHGDIKPDNILIRQNGEPVLIDFGASVEIVPESEQPAEIVATPAYAPPEQLSDDGPRGPWIDVFALAATVYEFMSGKPPIWAPRGSGFDPLIPVSASAELADEMIVIPVERVAREHYSTQLMLVIDRCLQPDYRARPRSIAELLRALSEPGDLDAASAVVDISGKMLQHFANWANPNDGLYADEFAMFIVSFPILDFAWRLGAQTTIQKAFERVATCNPSVLALRYQQDMIARGFRSQKGGIDLATLVARADAYAAAYMVDRKEEKWTYARTRMQLVKHCLAPTAPNDAESFSNLMEDVIDRARGRVKKAVRSALTPYYWVKTNSGWERKVKEEKGV